MKGSSTSRPESTEQARYRAPPENALGVQGPEPHSLREMLDLLEAATQAREKVSLGEALDAIGQHSFAPLLLLPGLIMAVPGPADIPGVPVLLGLLVTLIAVQMILHREHLWIPSWMERLQVQAATVQKMISWMRRPANWVDRLTKKRYTFLIDHAGYAAVAIACIVIAASTPLLEFVPLSANLAGVAIVAFGLALTARDGLLAGLAIVLSFGVITLIAFQFV